MMIGKKWESIEGEPNKFKNGAMTAEISGKLITLYVMDKKFLEFGSIDKIEEFSDMLKSLAEKIG